MNASNLAPLAVTVEIRALDTGPRLERAFRVSRAVGESHLRLERDLPFEAGRPVAVELALPDDPAPLRATGVVTAVPPDDPAAEGEAARPRAVALLSLDPEARRRLAAYVTERMLAP
jgi:hypothetical protein